LVAKLGILGLKESDSFLKLRDPGEEDINVR
jgi:hypothetical protein